MIPLSLLPHRISVEDYTGTTGNGQPAYGPAREVRARVDSRRRQVTTPTGQTVVGQATAVIRPTEHVEAEARVTHNGKTLYVLEVATIEGLRRPEFLELILGGPR